VPAHLVDDQGRALDAEYVVETDGAHLAVILESRSGMSGSRAAAEPGLQPGAGGVLAVRLTRLGRLDAVLVDALVDSRYTQQLGVPDADWRLVGAPIERADDGTLTATGGIHQLHDPWHVDDGTLTPLGFRYRVPQRPELA
jgi:hypothetical protein